MSTFRAFQTGLAAGQQQAKVRKEDDARTKAAEAFGKGNYEGAVSSLMGVGLMQDADAYSRAGDRHVEKEKTEAYAGAYKTGLQAGGPAKAASSVMEAAGSRGDMKTLVGLDEFIANSDARGKKAFVESMSFLGSTAIQLKNVPPEARGQAAVEILQKSPFANPEILAQIEQAAADGKITDEELDAFAMQTMSAAARIQHALDQRRAAETERHNLAMETKQSGGGIQLQFGEGGTLSNLSVGGTGPKGKEPAIVRDPQTGEPVVTPGQQQLAANKDWQRLTASEDKTALVLDDIKRAKDLVGPGTTGAAAVLKDIPIIGQSTDSGALGNLLKTIRANVGFDELQQMRENSPTGGALGQVAVQEIEFLQSVLGSLEQAQRPEDVKYNIERLERYLADRGTKRKEAFARDYPSLAQFVTFGKGVADQVQRLTATNPQTGEKVQYNDQTKAWEPAQ